jgi:ankyrin repeat protein
LDELPETLDATYGRTLLGINKQRRDYARCLFQCLVVAVRPLRIEELAELFTIQPHEDTSPWFNNNWRPVDPEEFILSACSTLVSIVNTDGEKVVQFSHFSVREYLTSDRIANSPTPVSHFHIPHKPAHALLARACLSVLLQLDYSIDETNLKIECFPLASYAAEHWGDHTRFEGVSSIRDIRDQMDRLFDRKKPHLDAWIWLYDPETNSRRRYLSPCPRQLDAVPLYYAALCGFHDLAGRLLDAYPQDLHARGGYHQTPLHAAVHEGHLNIVLLLLDRGASVESRGPLGQTALYMASSCGYAEIVRALIDHGADLNTECEDWDKGPFDDVKWTPLLVASKSGRLEVAEVLLEQGADVKYQDNLGRCPLHIASRYPSNDLVRLFIDHGANLDASDTEGATALHYASSEGQIAVVMSLFEHGASMDARDNFGWTPLHNASRGGHLEIVQELLDHGADGNTPTKDRWTALHVAAASGRLQVVEALLQYGADPHALTNKNKTPFQLASQENHIQVAQLLSEHTGGRMWCS